MSLRMTQDIVRSNASQIDLVLHHLEGDAVVHGDAHLPYSGDAPDLFDS